MCKAHAYISPLAIQDFLQIIHIVNGGPFLLDKFFKSPPNMPVLKTSYLMGLFPLFCITISMAASSILLEYEVSVLLLTELREPGMEALS